MAYKKSYGNSARAVGRAVSQGVRRAMNYKKKSNWMWYVGAAIAAYMFIAPVKTFVNNLIAKKEN